MEHIFINTDHIDIIKYYPELCEGDLIAETYEK